MTATAYEGWRVGLRRDLRRELHWYPELAWRAFYTTARIVAELRDLGVDDIQVGPDMMVESARSSVPDERTAEVFLDAIFHHNSRPAEDFERSSRRSYLW